MDSRIIQDKISVFAQHLLTEAKGDPVRALGLLTIVLDGPETLPADHAWRLVVEVRHVLIPEATADASAPLRHLVGTVSWEGEQQCLRCGKVLVKQSWGAAESLLPGYVFEIGPRLTSEWSEHYRDCWIH
jgi:hypothetical protein